MRRALHLTAFIAIATLAPALPATAGFLNGDCTATSVSGTSYREDGSQLDSKNVATATESDPFSIDPSGSVEWDARSDAPIKDHTWAIGLVIAGFEVQFYSGGDPNTAGTQESTGRVSISERLAEIQLTQMEWVLDQLNGKFEAWGRIDGDGAGCDGRAWVEIDGGFGVIGLTGAALALAGGGLILRAGSKKGT
ncbi:MAG TPA: hypothetical protein VIY70_02850 [Acidimicrobiia bacterium]